MEKFTFKEEVVEKLNNDQMRTLCGGGGGKRVALDHIGQNKNYGNRDREKVNENEKIIKPIDFNNNDF